MRGEDEWRIVSRCLLQRNRRRRGGLNMGSCCLRGGKGLGGVASVRAEFKPRGQVRCGLSSLGEVRSGARERLFESHAIKGNSGCDF